MKTIALAVLLAISFTVAAQENTFEQDVNKLVKITVDTSSKALMRGTVGFRNTAEEKEKFLKQYDDAVYGFLTKIEQFYLTDFTHDEIKQMLVFYESSAGRKFLTDKKKLVENDITPSKQWKDKISDIKEKLKKNNPESENEE